LPYFNIHGRVLPFYRVRLFEGDSKYRQPKDSPNYIYFPKTFQVAFKAQKERYIIITEGEKRAAAATKLGFPAVALSGVDAWRSRTILVPGSAQLQQAHTKLAVRLPPNSEMEEDYESPLAIGMLELLDLCVARGVCVIVCFDTDNSAGGCTTEVQRAAATLGYELRFRGISFDRIRQLVLPHLPDVEVDKLGLDDFLAADPHTEGGGALALEGLITKVLQKRSLFPRHPNVRDYVNRRLQKARIGRKEMQSVAFSILSDLDSHGIRLRASTNDAYYFDYISRKLLLSAWASHRDEQYDAPFNQYLYKEYGLSAADHRVLVWLGTQFTSEEPIEPVSPRRVITKRDSSDGDVDTLYFQVSDSEFVSINRDALRVHNNGDLNVLFQSDQVDALDTAKLVTEYQRQSQEPKVSCWWAATLSQVRLRDKDKQRIVAALLYYMSPWLLRWRGMQLPVELIVGESGSGKSTLCELRLEILTGRPLLRNTPTDLKDWHASVTNTGGLHVTDNVQLVDRTLRQRLSDEICRIITEPEPFIEQRKYYTNADQIRIPVRTVFAITAIQQPFQNADLLQRAFILELDKSVDRTKDGIIRYDSQWKENQLNRFGGREAWVAHHMLVLNRFFTLVAQKWTNQYAAKHRLINFEQSILLMAEVFGIPSQWIPDFLVNATDRAVGEADWILEGLYAFALEHNHPTLKTKRFRASVIVEWCSGQEEFKSNDILTNVRKLGRYLQAHKSAVFHLTGIAEAGTDSNRVCYRFDGDVLDRR